MDERVETVKKRKAIVFFGPGDEQRLVQQYLGQLPTTEFIQNCYKSLCNYLEIGHGEGIEQEWHLSFQDFCATYQYPPKKVDACLSLLDQGSIFHRMNTNKQNASCHLRCSPSQFKLELEKAPSSHSTILQLLGRAYAGIFKHEVNIDLDLIVRKSKLPFGVLIEILEHYKQQGILSFNYAMTDIHLIGITARDDQYTLRELLRNTQSIYAAKKERLTRMLDFIQAEDQCKQKDLLTYFGESVTESCGQCSAAECRSNDEKTPLATITAQIMEYVEREPLATHQLKLSLPHLSMEELAEGLEWLMKQQKIKKNALAQITKV